MRAGPFAFRYQGNGATPCQYIDTTRKAIDCATALPLTAFISERELTFAFAICCRPSVCLSVCRLSVTFVRPTQAIQIFGNISAALDTLAIRWHQLANGNSRSRSLYAVARPSVCLSSVCNVRAPYSDGSNFRQYFCGIRYLGHPLTSTENFMEILQGEPLRRAVKHKRGNKI